jgi:Fe2+ transport system protein FeoA
MLDAPTASGTDDALARLWLAHVNAQHFPSERLAMHDLLPLNCLHHGQQGVVEEVLGDHALVHRLREMGLHAGVAIEMVQSGSPCIVRLGSQKLCLRAEELSQVMIRTGIAL